MEPWQSWTVVLLGGGAAWWYYNKQSKPKTKTGKVPLISEEVQKRSTKRRDENKVKKKTDDNASATEPSGNDIPVVPSVVPPATDTSTNKQLKKRRSGKKPSDPASASSAVLIEKSGNDHSTAEVHTDEGMDNREFAKQLSEIKTGTPLAPPTRAGSNRKSKKKAVAKENIRGAPDVHDMSSSQAMSTASSTTGMDADDDLSSTNSPALGATTSKGLDISDMLETPAAGPSILRLTGPNQPAPGKSTPKQKGLQAQETKKQRQNRQKHERKKVARQQGEKERRVLLEKQLRTAREAEGRPTMNGMTSSKPPTTNAWPTAAKPTGTHESSSAATSTSDVAPLLDTFDKNGPVKAATNGSQGEYISTAAKAWQRDLPSEEDQIRMLNEMNEDHGWNTVQNGRKRRNKRGNSTATNTESSDGSMASGTNGRFDPLSERSGNTTGSNVAVGYGSSVPSHPNDSDWAVV